MKKQTRPYALFAVALTFALGVMLLPGVAQAKAISKKAKVGAYSLNLKVLPAEAFTGPNAPMVRDAGAQPNTLNGPENPNHHMVVFVKEKGKPVEKATVVISYRQLSPKRSTWTELPVVRMHVAGKSLATTHYGNNVKLSPGKYEVHVTVNGSATATFHFNLSS